MITFCQIKEKTCNLNTLELPFSYLRKLWKMHTICVNSFCYGVILSVKIRYKIHSCSSCTSSFSHWSKLQETVSCYTWVSSIKFRLHWFWIPSQYSDWFHAAFHKCYRSLGTSCLIYFFRWWSTCEIFLRIRPMTIVRSLENGLLMPDSWGELCPALLWYLITACSFFLLLQLKGFYHRFHVRTEMLALVSAVSTERVFLVLNAF